MRVDLRGYMQRDQVEISYGVILEPCPFCGNHSSGLFVASRFPHVTCFTCGAYGPAMAQISRDESIARRQALVAWNRRHKGD